MCVWFVPFVVGNSGQIAREREGCVCVLRLYFGRSRAPSTLYSWSRQFQLVCLPEMCFFLIFLLRKKNLLSLTYSDPLFSLGIYSTSPNPTAAYLTSQHMHGYGAQQMPLQPQQHQQQAGHRST